MTMTEESMNQEIGYFEVISAEGASQTVIVSQNVTVSKVNMVLAARKIFTLNTSDGKKVSCTEDPQFFITEEGALLKKVGLCEANGYSTVFYPGRRSR